MRDKKQLLSLDLKGKISLSDVYHCKSLRNLSLNLVVVSNNTKEF